MLTICTSLFAHSTSAQTTVALASNDMNIISTAASTSGGETPLPYLSALQARQVVRNSFALLREYSVTIEGDLMSYSLNENDPKTVEKKAAEATKNEAEKSSNVSFEALSKLPDEKFEEYLAGMSVILAQKIKKSETDLTTDDAAKVEKKALLTRLQSVLKSATCLVNKSEGIFIKTKDLDGNDIIAFKLDSLRSNARYSLVENFREGLSRIRKDQVYGFLNYCGEEVIPAQYEFADAFNSGKALVKKVDWYFLDPSGEESDALENIADAKGVKNGVSLAKTSLGKFAFINNDYARTKQFTSAQFDAIDQFYGKQIFRVRNLKKYGLITLEGNVKLPIIYDAIESANSTGLYRIKNEEKWGLMDSLGNVKVMPIYTSISDFDKFGIATAIDESGIHLLNGKTMVTTKGYASISNVNSMGLATVRDNTTKLFGLINDKLEVVVKPTFTSLGEFNKLSMAKACLTPKACGYINPKGEAVIPLAYDDLTDFSPHGLVIAKGTEAGCTGNKCNYEIILDKTGKIIVPKAVKNASDISYDIIDSLFCKEFISVKVKEGGTSGFQLLNKTNFKIVNITPYESVYPIDIYGNIRVSNDNKIGIIDTTGKVLAKCIYKEIKRPNENYYPTKNDDGKWGFIDKKGKPQIPFEYDEVRNFRLGYTIVQKGKEFGVINRFNAKVVPCAFKTAQFTDDHKYILTEENGNDIILNDQLDCTKNCTRLDEIRRVEAGTK
jgi:WG containing repeat